MKTLKIASLILAGFSTYTVAASVTQNCEPFNPQSPCKINTWEINYQSLNLKPTYQRQDTLISSPLINSASNDNRQDTLFGYQLKAEYKLNKNENLYFAWYHAHQDQMQKHPANNFNAELGKSFELNRTGVIKFKAGVQYSDLNLGVKLANTAPKQLNVLGPRLGVNVTQNLGRGLSIYSDTASSVLVNNNINPKILTIPAFEEKFGLSYNSPMENSQLSFYAGYLWQNYISPLFESSESKLDNTYAMKGPYAEVKWSS